MRRNNVKSSLLFIIFLGVILAPYTTYATTSIGFEIENVVWGTPDNYPIQVEPGDVGVPLTIFVRNLSNSTLRGVRGTLYLDDPFVDYQTGSKIAKATASPVETGDVFNQTGDILPMGSFTLTFYINVDPDAKKGVYEYNLTISYWYAEGGFFLSGEERNYTVEIRIYNSAPQVYSADPSSAAITLNPGDEVNFTVKARDPDNDSLTYEWFYDDLSVGNQTSYYFVANDDIGTHTLEVRVSDGNLTTYRTWTINIQRDVETTFTVSSYYLFAGITNNITISIKNNLWEGTVSVSYNVPNPLVVKGNTSWTFEDVKPNDTVEFYVLIYTPLSVYGNTIPTTVSVTYTDEHGNQYADSYTASYIVRGYIRIVVYDITVSPNPAKAGDRVSLSATILNKGNSPAYFTNVTVIPDGEYINLDPQSNTYIGDVDANSPAPFTIYIRIDSETPNGTYPVTVNVYYEDELFEPHEVNVTFYVQVFNLSESENNGAQGEFSILDVLYQGGWVVLVGGAFIALFTIFYSKRKERVLSG
ncbi:MAG: COG1361 S-layer family protein [Candidatus Asgardarchaeia archaeon]